MFIGHFFMGIRIFGLQGCQWPYQGSRELLIFWICMWYMFICQFFNGYQNFEVTRVTKAILRFQVNNENGNPRDQDRELFIFFQICMWYMFICKFFNGDMALVPLVTPEIRIPIRKLVNKLVSHAYLKKMNNSLSWSLRLPVSFTWTRSAWPLSTLKPLNWHINMYHILIWKK